MHLLDIPWDALTALIHVIVHLDQYIHAWVTEIGPWIYLVAFVIIVLETGVILCPFLPGDSLLFALGAVAISAPEVISVPLLMLVLVVAAILGGLLNYATGSYIGPRIFQGESSKWFKKEHLIKTHSFYEKHGGKTIVLARFIPIFRTFVPFVAGVGKMDYKRFFAYNFIGATVWIVTLVLAGCYFGNIPIVRKNFGAVVPVVIIISILPIFFERIAARFRKKSKS